MCGIVGLFTPNSTATRDLAAARDRLAHRGPDERGSYAAPGIYLGARRLAIIDVAHGQQPLATEGEAVWTIQNGEIYNYRELRAELEALGHVFKTHGDTEVIAHAYEQWGAGCAAHLRGITAFAVWDTRRRRLLLGRDRFGVKPLYYTHLPGGGLAFASEIQPLLDLGAPRTPDRAALRALFAVGFIPTPHTAFAGVHKLPPAHTLLAEGEHVTLTRYWDVPATGASNGHTPSYPEAVEGIRAHLDRAVREQRMSEVPLGALISGGLDSTSIAALLQAQAGEPLHTFNIGFETPGYDESEYAALAAAHLGTRHHQVRFTAADFERYPAVLRHLEEPQTAATALPIYLLYQACRAAGLVVILTGEGADEVFGGYHWFPGDAQAQRLLRLPAPVRALVACSPAPISAAGRRVLRSGERDVLRRYALWQQPGASALAVLSPALFETSDLLADWPATLGAAAAGRDPFRQFQYYETHTRLVDFINFEVDRMSMANSIEARVPFLDHLLWEYAATLPTRYFVGKGESKGLLRAAVRDRVPGQILTRRKQGLAAPHAAWLRAARWPEWAEAVLTDAAIAAAGYFHLPTVRARQAAHRAGRGDHSRVLMGVLSTQLWHQHFIAAA
ncbi:MAG: asparagine synthase (glutamine-hydrolyzing) [Anaerolineales bacterium]|nr:asparagine synthase (glutamine-hydrolyzing) [Anaerolineales bacterium]